ncbi:MAG TPA: MFS transporter [Candidatus Saccharimonadales bacterium]|nr:MFS transporter [Candidatus Saccharimonadales bacterium]
MGVTASKFEGRALPVVMFTVFLDAIGIGVLVPLFPQLFYKVFLPAGYSIHSGYIALGWLTGMYALMQFISTPILGQLSDRFGRKRVLGLSLLTTALGYALLALGIMAKNIPLLFAARAIAGIGGGNVSVARAIVADVSSAEHRTRNFGLIGAGFGMGFVFGPFFGARFSVPHASFLSMHTPSWFTTATPLWITAGIGLINIALLIARLPETNKYRNSTRIVWSKSLSNIRKAATSRSLRTVLTTELAFWGGFTFFTSFLALQLVSRLHYSTVGIGNLFAYIGICIAVAQGALVPVLAKRFKNYQVVRSGMIAMGGSLLLQLLVHNTAELLIVGALIAFCYSVLMTNVSALVSSSAGPEIQGEVLGIEASVQAIGESVPAIIAGYIATIGINTPNLIGALIILFGGLLFTVFYRSRREVLHQDN